ncbi:unnamed protein product [Meloidogyne enterolobii]|uniref:Uncharacterized protein n=3 Tax=Meloidogyne enterolobii TaxID=390850 RepID=A0ACB1B379_MELEN
MKRQFSHLQILNLVKKNLLKNPGLPPALPPSLSTNTENNGNNPLANNNEEKPENNKNLEDKKEEKINSGENKNNNEQINEEFRIGQETTLPSLADSIPTNSEGFPPASPPSYIQCLHRIQSKICDPDNVLIQSQKSEIDEMLKELEDATRKDNLQNECDRSGLEVMVIIVKHSNLLDNTLDSVQKKLSDALNIWVQDPDHHCEKPLILMMSADPEIPNRKVWTGRHYSVPVDPAELVKLFMDQEQLLAKEKYSEVILNIIDGVLNKYEQRAFNG